MAAELTGDYSFESPRPCAGLEPAGGKPKMANSECCTWPTRPEPEHHWTGVLSYKESDGAKHGVPVRTIGKTTLRHLEQSIISIAKSP